MVLNFNINKLDDNIKKRVNEYAFIRIVASELAALYNSGVRNAIQQEVIIILIILALLT